MLHPGPHWPAAPPPVMLPPLEVTERVPALAALEEWLRPMAPLPAAAVAADPVE